MGQVPRAKILLVGRGRLASALKLELERTLEPASWRAWSRTDENFSSALDAFKPTHIWLAISDSAILPFVQENSERLSKLSPIIVHFAGSLCSFQITDLNVHAAHPLSTFTLENSQTDFTKIPFVLDRGGPNLDELMPGFTNPVFRLDSEKRVYYHTLCAIAGNFTTLLWESIASRFESDLQISKKCLDVYRDQVFKNLDDGSCDSNSRLTGPLSRGDRSTMKSHRAALFERSQVPLLKIYDAFTDLYRTDRQEKK